MSRTRKPLFVGHISVNIYSHTIFTYEITFPGIVAMIVTGVVVFLLNIIS